MLSDLFSPIRLTCVITGSRARDAITYMTVTERFVIIEHASVVITSVYWIIKAEKEGREEPRPRAETEIFFRRLKSWETFLGSGIITYAHLPETVDRKYALSAERTTFFPFSFSRSPPPPPSRPPLFASPPARPDSLTKDKAPQWGISINQTNQQERRPPISPPTSASPETPSQGCRMFLCFSGFCWPPTLALATTTAILVGNLPFSLTVSLCARNEQIEAGLCPLMCLWIWDVFKGKLGLTFSRLGRKYVMWGNNLPKTKVYTMWGQTERLILMLKPDISECGACCIEKWSLERSEGRFTLPKRHLRSSSRANAAVCVQLWPGQCCSLLSSLRDVCNIWTSGRNSLAGIVFTLWACVCVTVEKCDKMGSWRQLLQRELPQKE